MLLATGNSAIYLSQLKWFCLDMELPAKKSALKPSLAHPYTLGPTAAPLVPVTKPREVASRTSGPASGRWSASGEGGVSSAFQVGAQCVNYIHSSA